MLTLLQANYSSFFNWVLITSTKASIFIIFLLGVKFVLRHKMEARFQYMLWSVLIIGLVLPWTPNSPVSIYNYLDSSHIQQMIASIIDRTTESPSANIAGLQPGLDLTAVIDDNSNIFIILWGPFEGTKTLAVGSILTSRHPQVVKAFLSDEEISEIVNKYDSSASPSNSLIRRTVSDASAGITIDQKD